jgi:hypothetical protein
MKLQINSCSAVFLLAGAIAMLTFSTIQSTAKENQNVADLIAPPNYLAGLRKSDADRSDHERALLMRLEASKLPTTKKAESAAIGYKMTHGGLLAEERPCVIGLIQIGKDVKDLAQKGDLIWVVRIVDLTRRATDEMWVSSTTGVVRAVLGAAKDEKPK